MNRRNAVLAVLIVIGIGAAYIRIDYAFSYVLAILPSVLDEFGLLESKGEKAAKQRKMEFARDQLRAYSEFYQILSDVLNNSPRYLVRETSDKRYAHAPLAAVEKIDTLLQKEAYLIDQVTKDNWRALKATVHSGVNPAQDIDVDLAEALQISIRSQIENLKKKLNLE
ncbi:MAG: hypothetical protein ACLPY5_15625 [Candidatus Bathyarchaeia archaeon]